MTPNDTPIPSSESPTEASEPNAGRCAVATGSASEIIMAEISGLPIRKLNRERLLQTGDKLSNKFGQELWSVVACHPKGVRVQQWPLGNMADYTWEQLYGFYERVPAELQNPADEPRAAKTTDMKQP